MNLDLRIVRVGIEVSGQLRVYENLAMTATITKVANTLENEAQITITNLAKDVRDHLVTETSPFNRNRRPKRVTIEVGRVSTGTSLIYVGDITEAKPSQPPDVTVTLKARTSYFQKGTIVSKAHGAQTSMRTIAQQIATDMGLQLSFEAQDKNISNYSFTGALPKQIDRLGDMGHVNAYVDDNRLIVKDYGAPLLGTSHVLSEESGLVGIPEATEQGLKARFLFSPSVKLGGRLTLQSKINPAVNGDYTIYKLTYEIASRDTPFYCVAESMRLGRMIYPLYRY